MKLYLIQEILNESDPSECAGSVWIFDSAQKRSKLLKKLIKNNNGEQWGEYTGYETFEKELNDCEIIDELEEE